MYSQHENTNSKGDFVLKTSFINLRISGIKKFKSKLFIFRHQSTDSFYETGSESCSTFEHFKTR